jgi:putative membrane protein insertion efficiency factor
LFVRFYITFLSPFFGGGCRFHPSCSNYAHEAIARHGARRGFALALKRLLRCNPFVKGGFDPVPEPAPSSAEQSSWAQGRQESAQ